MIPRVDTRWAFGGPLAHLHPPHAWIVLALAAALCAFLAWLSYFRSVPRLPLPKALVLTCLRTALFVALLCSLAGPVRIESTVVPPPPSPPPSPQVLAVLVDRSDSMTRPDNRGLTRLDGALALWRRLEPAARDAFPKIRTFSLAADLRPAATLDEAAARTGNTGQTFLYRSVASLLKDSTGEPPNAIVVLTDGLDTSEDASSELRDAALASQTPIYFVPGINRSPPEPFLRVREWRAPATVARATVFTVDLSFEAFSTEDRVVPFSLWEDGRRVDGGRLSLTLGSNLVPWKFHVDSGEPGVRELSLRLGENASDPLAARSITVVRDRQPVRVLIYQSALDWGFRTLADALQNDPDFKLTAAFAPFPRAGQTVEARFQGGLPDSIEGYKAYDCVVLARLNLEGLTASQQVALGDFVRGGGGALFVNPLPPTDDGFGESLLGELLPVVITPGDAESSPSESIPPPPLFPDVDDDLAPDMGALEPFVLTEAGRSSPIFAAAGGGTLVPQFGQFDEVSHAKPGTDVLAVHPIFHDPTTGQPYILLATETFGRGRTAFLATDGLWRWKLSEPSTSRAVETFWQQFLRVIGDTENRPHLHFVDPAIQTQVGASVSFKLAGADAAHQPEVLASPPGGPATRLHVEPTGDPDNPWQATWKPDQSGNWQLTASVDRDPPAYAFPSVVAPPVGELARTPTATDAMSDLATATGGALLENAAPPTWHAPEPEKPAAPVVQERRRLLWNTGSLLGLMLGLYAAELLLRRLWKLV